MKIAYLKAYDTRDKRTSSGTAYYIARALEKYCGEVVHLSPIPFNDSKEKLIGKAINKICVRLLGKEFEYHESFLLSRLFAKYAESWLAEQSFDVVVTFAGDPELAFLKTSIPIILINDITEKLLIDYYFPFRKKIVKRSVYEMNVIQGRVLKKVCAAIYSSHWAAHSALEDYGADPAKIYVVPFGANLDEVPSREMVLARKKSGQCRLLFLGVNWTRKGGDIAFETLLKLEERGIQAELVICGCTPPQEVVHERVKVIPFLDKNDKQQHKELEHLLMTADFMLMPTRVDCTPMSFCEASAFGLPVITTDTGGVPEVVKEGENGYLLPLEARGDAYAEVIASVYHDDERYAELVKSSRAAFEERLNWDAWGHAVKRILDDVPAQKSSH